jgi:hypothetical protein
MPTDIFKVISYNKINGSIERVRTVYRGNYDKCLDFYMSNKSKYRERNEYLELMIY